MSCIGGDVVAFSELRDEVIVLIEGEETLEHVPGQASGGGGGWLVDIEGGWLPNPGDFQPTAGLGGLLPSGRGADEDAHQGEHDHPDKDGGVVKADVGEPFHGIILPALHSQRRPHFARWQVPSPGRAGIEVTRYLVAAGGPLQDRLDLGTHGRHKRTRQMETAAGLPRFVTMMFVLNRSITAK
jgi:hypothetical protein